MVEERLQKILSNTGVSSRRAAEQLILEGRVTVNGVVVRTLGARADLATDEVTVDGVPVVRERYRYFMLNKPPGFVTTVRDEQGRETVLDLVPIGDVKLHPVGRLDVDSEGLVILTNDGHLTNLLTHPRHQVEKEYLVGIDRPLSARDAVRAVRGIDVDGERLRFASIKSTLAPEQGSTGEVARAAAWLLVVLRQGRNREIRRLLAELGREVRLLRRLRIGPLYLGTIGSGAFREITPEEVKALYDSASAPAAGDALSPAPTSIRPDDEATATSENHRD